MANHQSHTAGRVRLHAESRGMCKSSPAGALTVNLDYKMYNMSVVLAGLCKKNGGEMERFQQNLAGVGTCQEITN